MQPTIALAVFIAASNGHFLNHAFDALHLGRRQDPQDPTGKAAGFSFQRDRAPPKAAANRAQENNIMRIKKIPDEDLKKAAEVAKEALKHTDQLERYGEAVKTLSDAAADATKCYKAYAEKGSEPISNPDAIAACDKQYENAQSLLRNVGSIFGESSALTDDVLFEAKLPNIKDGRPTHEDTPTKELQAILANLKRVTDRAAHIQTQADKMQPYYEQVKKLGDEISNTQECYHKFNVSIHKAGFESVAQVSKDLDPCNTLFTQVQSTLQNAQKLIKEPNSTIRDGLAQFELPDLKDGFQSDTKTQQFWSNLEKLKKSKDDASSTVGAFAELEKYNATITEKIKSMVKTTVAEEWPQFLQFVALSEARSKKSDEAILRLIKSHGDSFVEELEKQSHKMAEMVAKHSLAPE
ncbi:hypothetical protein QQS21_012870 [Conoideocrella luteorostrata]|uniref:Uncharacterized protein n=1 Tax=Conoideocrella luteorostrata TaxID=1105319 RepID=A0AAJ0FS30_9HYPO|nr:hypothetical protein QQS21_012870 [Conoideocrella luteorostrata]